MNEFYKKTLQKQIDFFKKRPLLKKIMLIFHIGSALALTGLYLTSLGIVFARANAFSWSSLKLAVLPLSGFLVCSVLRMTINRSRPYENGIEPLLKKSTKGRSFPSRHATSGFGIGTTLLAFFPILGVVTILLSLGMSYTRYLCGLHYPSDLFVGALIGVVSGVWAFL